MRSRYRLPLLITLLICLPTLRASGQEDAQGAPQPEATAAQIAFQPIDADFRNLYQSLRNLGGIGTDERIAIRGLLDRVGEFNQAHPDHAPSVAMMIQLSRWLGIEDQLPDLYRRLASLQPDNIKVALAALQYQTRSDGRTPDELHDEYRRLYDRFPDRPEVLAAWAEHLRKLSQYTQAVAVLEAADLDPAAQPDAVYTLAHCLFAEHQFQKAHDTLSSIPDATLARRLDLQRRVQEHREPFQQYAELWQQEQAIRAEEAVAGDLPQVQIVTSKGPIILELFENQAPNTVANFISLAEAGFYDSSAFHRYEPDFMIQGGDPNTKPGAEGRPGVGDPGYFIPDEHRDENLRRHHFRGSVAMANRGGPDTAGCQFYLTHKPTWWLNGKNTVFGRIIDGLDLARTLREGDQIITVAVISKRDHPYEPRTLERGSVEVQPR